MDRRRRRPCWRNGAPAHTSQVEQGRQQAIHRYDSSSGKGQEARRECDHDRDAHGRAPAREFLRRIVEPRLRPAAEVSTKLRPDRPLLLLALIALASAVVAFGCALDPNYDYSNYHPATP